MGDDAEQQTSIRVSGLNGRSATSAGEDCVSRPQVESGHFEGSPMAGNAVFAENGCCLIAYVRLRRTSCGPGKEKSRRKFNDTAP